jgi:hypothetical protein
MKHCIELYDIETGEHLGDIDIPVSRTQELAGLMGWSDPEVEIYIYELSTNQVKVLEEWTGRIFSAPGRIAHLAAKAD